MRHVDTCERLDIIISTDFIGSRLHKSLLILGLLVHRPLHGYELHRIVRAHGELYTDLKKANLYYLLLQSRFAR